jgi:hypothetical protein
VVFCTAWPSLKSPRLEADDYRYLHHIQQWKHGAMSTVESMTVENRWDHLWFMQEEGRIRFFRPTVVLSYALDWALWGDDYPRGLALSNVLMHLACTLLVGILLHRLVGPGVPSIVSTMLFAGLAAHSECIWYVAGRTDSLAALGFLAAFTLHVHGKRWWALPCFAFGFITKELVVVAPLVFFFFDRFIERRKTDWKLYAVYGLGIIFVLIAKRAALGGDGSDFVYPYLISPLRPEFIEHLWLQFRSYMGNLFAGEITVPFADAETVALLHRPWVPIAGMLAFTGIIWLLRRDWRVWMLMLLGLLTWLPTSFVYLSERYLYLPSVAFVGILGLFVATRSIRWRWGLCFLLAAFMVFQSLKLYGRHVELAGQPGSVQEMLRQLEPVRNQIKPADHLLTVNTPGLFVRAQFMQDILRVVLDDPELRVDVLTMMPGQNGTAWEAGDPLPVMGAGVQVRWEDTRRLIISGRVLGSNIPPCRIQEYGHISFNWSPLDTGSQRANATFRSTILAGGPAGASAIEFEFFQDIENPKILVWNADCSDLNEHPWDRRKDASVALQTP